MHAEAFSGKLGYGVASALCPLSGRPLCSGLMRVNDSGPL